jgi:Holliday junction resolvase RusA-like endonuclease
MAKQAPQKAVQPTERAAVTIVIPGAITPWKRAQRRRMANGATVTFTDRDVEAYHATVRLAAERAMNGAPPLDGAIVMAVNAIFAPPRSWSGKRRHLACTGMIGKTSRPDIENSVKGAMDALQTIAYRDDSQIVRLTASKCYGDRPRLEITLTPLF